MSDLSGTVATWPMSYPHSMPPMPRPLAYLTVPPGHAASRRTAAYHYIQRVAAFGVETAELALRVQELRGLIRDAQYAGLSLEGSQLRICRLRGEIIQASATCRDLLLQCPPLLAEMAHLSMTARSPQEVHSWQGLRTLLRHSGNAMRDHGSVLTQLHLPVVG